MEDKEIKIETKTGVYKKLLDIQMELKAPKLQYNSFGKYKYRSCEDILEAVKPLLNKYKATIFLSDDIINVGNRNYVQANAVFMDVETGEKIFNRASAREDETLKGMTGAQITGTASSYARKYALNGLLSIDDTKDTDTNEYAKQASSKTLVFEPCTDEQIKEAMALGIDIPSMLKYCKVTDIKDISKERLETFLERKRK